jgi:orotate phosphoribosyltransferase
MSENEVMKLMEEKGAVLKGHFVLSSGRHSDTFVQKFRLLEDPRATKLVGEMLAAKFPEGFDVVAAPAVGAVVLGFTTALGGGARSIFSERVDGGMAFRRGFGVAAGERVLVVEDVVTTGGSAREVVELVTAQGGEVIGIGALVDRGDSSRTSLGAPMRALATLAIESWSAVDCPLCAAGIPVSDPGSRRLVS